MCGMPYSVRRITAKYRPVPAGRPAALTCPAAAAAAGVAVNATAAAITHTAASPATVQRCRHAPRRRVAPGRAGMVNLIMLPSSPHRTVRNQGPARLVHNLFIAARRQQVRRAGRFLGIVLEPLTPPALCWGLDAGRITA